MSYERISLWYLTGNGPFLLSPSNLCPYTAATIPGVVEKLTVKWVRVEGIKRTMHRQHRGSTDVLTHLHWN